SPLLVGHVLDRRPAQPAGKVTPVQSLGARLQVLVGVELPLQSLRAQPLDQLLGEAPFLGGRHARRHLHDDGVAFYPRADGATAPVAADDADGRGPLLRGYFCSHEIWPCTVPSPTFLRFEPSDASS